MASPDAMASSQELLEAQALIWNHNHNHYLNGMTHKGIMHTIGATKCIKILGKCKEAIIHSGGKVIIVDVENKGHVTTETQLLMDMLMVTNHGGKEMNEKEWGKLFVAAGFNNYKITPILGLRSVIELFP